MKIAFIAGPYFGDGSYDVIERNIQDAEVVAIELANRGVPFFCPHLHTRHFEAKAKAPEPFYHALDLHFLQNVAGCIIALPRGRLPGQRPIMSWFSIYHHLMTRLFWTWSPTGQKINKSIYNRPASGRF